MKARWTWIVGLLLAAFVALVGALFVVQNLPRTTQLSLDLYVAAWQLSEPISVPLLAGAAFGVGFLVAALLLLGRLVSLTRKVKTLQRKVGLSSSEAADPWR